jgi:PPOX class probable FMN-dependent enzyme
MTEIATQDELRSRYRSPSEISLRKDIGHVDAAARSYLEASPFVVVASTSDDGTDASPRGGPPGFVKVLDEHRVALPDLSGNNRLDTLGNLVAHPAVGLLFFVPGVDESLRINGRATVTDDPAVLDACVVDGKRPRVAVVVDVEQCYIHCAKAFRRAGMWDPSSWLADDERPKPECILQEHLAWEGGAEDVREVLEKGYEKTMWEVGGRPSEG